MTKTYAVPIIATGHGSTRSTFELIVSRLRRLGVGFTTDANYFVRTSSLLEETHIVRQSPLAPGINEEEISTTYVHRVPGRYPLLCLRRSLLYWPPNVWFTPHVAHELAHLLSRYDPADTDEYSKDFILLDASCAQYLGFSRREWENWQFSSSSPGGDWEAAKGYLPKGSRWPRFPARHIRQAEWAEWLQDTSVEDFAIPKRFNTPGRVFRRFNGVNPILSRLFGYETDPLVEMGNAMATTLMVLHAKGGQCPFCRGDLTAQHLEDAHTPECLFRLHLSDLLPFDEGKRSSMSARVDIFPYTGNA